MSIEFHPRPNAGRHIVRSSTPITLFTSKNQFQRLTLCEKLVPDPVLLIRLPVQRSTLDIYVFIRGVEMQIPDRRCLICDRMREAYRLEEWREDEIYVLAWVREETHHGEDCETAHGAGIVVSW